jgi:hypothetical protein
MKIWLRGALVALAMAFLISFAAQAQKPIASPRSAQANAVVALDPHDLSGYWEFFTNAPGQGIYATPSKDPPVRTPWGQARYDAAKPGYGPKAQPGGNDPILRCWPSGIPRIMFFPQPFEIVQTKDRLFMFFERERAWRAIWTDGRGHPADLEPLWMGHSIGKWEGDTFVVDSVGFNDKAWLDFYGNPHSDKMHLVERWKRVDAKTLALNFTVYDPKAYTKPWVSDTKVFKKLTGSAAYMEELFCIADEEQAFTNRIRIPALGRQPSKQ